ncbi:hypothetical protein acsn021_09390 [Anaerocolumna cellulosilytica]|uniref:Uncharacterized protein n=1 Tax=Anaerocolumna cellulosilytica TaxID=433286 RepID=A0A6S6R227_9FIRM|nr:hypothetical protein acsn021_09390 [Anaerocolumna cellulosilytica]
MTGIYCDGYNISRTSINETDKIFKYQKAGENNGYSKADY